MRKSVISLAAVIVGVVAFGATACKDDATDAASDPSHSPAASAGSSSAAPPPAATPSAHGTPTWNPGKRPKITGNQVIMIDPDGKRYTRKTMVELAAGMGAINERHGLPADFCVRSYVEGVKKGGTFPAGKAAFLEACQEGLRLAKQH